MCDNARRAQQTVRLTIETADGNITYVLEDIDASRRTDSYAARYVDSKHLRTRIKMTYASRGIVADPEFCEMASLPRVGGVSVAGEGARVLYYGTPFYWEIRKGLVGRTVICGKDCNGLRQHLRSRIIDYLDSDVKICFLDSDWRIQSLIRGVSSL